MDRKERPRRSVEEERLHVRCGRGAGQAASFCSTKRVRLPTVSKTSAEMSSSSTAMSNCSSRAVITVTTAMESNSGMLPKRGVEGSKRSEEHTSELQSLMRISYAVFCLKKKHIIVEKSYSH